MCRCAYCKVCLELTRASERNRTPIYTPFWQFLKNLQPSVKHHFCLSVLHRTPSVLEQGIRQSVSTDLSSTTRSNSLAGWRRLRCVDTTKCIFSRAFSILFLITSCLMPIYLHPFTNFPYKWLSSSGSYSFGHNLKKTKTKRKQTKTGVRWNGSVYSVTWC